MGSVKKGGDIATIRLSVHKAKPSIIVLTEIAEQTKLKSSLYLSHYNLEAALAQSSPQAMLNSI